MDKQKIFKLIYPALISFLLVVGIALRLVVFDKVGGDYVTYKGAMALLHQGLNPYVATVASFKNQTGEHGYAYFPTLLYIQYGIWLLDNFSGVIISTVLLWKIPVLICDLIIAILLLKKFKTTPLYGVCSLALWFLNPYFIARYDYSLYDPIFLLFLFLALEKLETKPGLSGLFYALTISLKTIPIILLPLFLLKTPNKLKFLLACIGVFFAISVPFMKSVSDFTTYLQGAFFVHTERELQGRPLLSYVFYYMNIPNLQYNHVKEFALISMVLALVVPLTLYIRKKFTDKYTWVLISFAIYLALTPVLSRTHILWITPWLLICVQRIRKQLAQIGILVAFWLISFFYLLAWNKGFDGPKLVTDKASWELPRLVRQKYYEIRGKINNN